MGKNTDHCFAQSQSRCFVGGEKKKGFVSFLPIEGVLNNKQVFDQVSRTFPSSKSVSLFLANGRFAATTAKKKQKKRLTNPNGTPFSFKDEVDPLPFSRSGSIDVLLLIDFH